MPKKTCPDCGAELVLVCVKCPRKKGGQTTAKKYSTEQRREWGAKGGRPKKKL